MSIKFEFNEDKKDILVQSSIISKIFDVSQKTISNYVNDGMPFVMVTEKQKGFYVRECLDWYNLNIKKQDFLENNQNTLNNQVNNIDFSNVVFNDYEKNKINEIFITLIDDLKPNGLLQLSLIKDLAIIELKKERLEKFQSEKIKNELLSLSEITSLYIYQNRELKECEYKKLVLSTAIDIYSLYKQNKPMYCLDFLSDNRNDEIYTSELNSNDIEVLSKKIQKLKNPNIKIIIDTIDNFHFDKENIELYNHLIFLYKDYFSILQTDILTDNYNLSIIEIDNFVGDFIITICELHDNKNFIDFVDNHNNKIIHKPDLNNNHYLKNNLFSEQSQIIKQFKELQKF